jgi:hypothetical protein
MRPLLSSLVVVVLAQALLASAIPGVSPQGAAAVAAAKPPKADETLTNFKKYFKTYKETPVRVEALLALEGVEDAAVVDTIAPVLKDPDPQVVDAVVRVLAQFKERAPVDRMLAILKDEKTEAIRIGILRALGDGKYPDCGPAIAVCLADKVWMVRFRALKAMAVSSDPALAAQIVPMCDDPEMAVRCEAIETLARMKSDLVVPKAIASLSDSIWQVRSSALIALTAIRSKDSIEPLINRLSVEEGVLVPAFAEALANLTGNEFGPDLPKWKAWWTEIKAAEQKRADDWLKAHPGSTLADFQKVPSEKGGPWMLPSAEAIAYLRTKHEAATGKPRGKHDGEGVRFTKVDTMSRSIMFVIDVSGSMEAEVTEKERFSDGNYPSFQRIDIVKTELTNTIDRLEPYVNFNILSFATKVKPWKDKLQPATILNKSAAKDWIKGLQAIGGASKEDLASVGLVGSANLEMGKTATYDALMTALNVKSNGPKTGTYNETKDYAVDVDTVFFLSDGRPTVGVYVDPDDILREVKSANELRKVVIHTIAIGEFQKDFMKKIAEQNHGVFVDLGK